MINLKKQQIHSRQFNNQTIVETFQILYFFDPRKLTGTSFIIRTAALAGRFPVRFLRISLNLNRKCFL